MLAARLSTLGSNCARGMLKSSVVAPKSPFTPVVRGYREAGRGFTPMEVGQIAVAGGAVLGMGALCYYGLGMSNEPGAIDRVVLWPQYVRDRIRDTYSYFGASCVVVAASGVAVYRSHLGQRFIALCSRHPIMSTVGLLVGAMGTGYAMMSIPYSPGLGAKQMMWLVNCGVLGLIVAPIGALGGAIAIRAAWYTAGLSTVAACAPSDKFLNWAGPLGIGLGGVLVVRKAESHPNMYGVMPYDPINMSHHIVMDALNIFIRIAQILGMVGGRRK
ncbi:Growth hormone-inducible transmembrane protein-like [Homarus americanus]|uniref:Growth hormone-inducible transmembrane protein-like n=1 Tax=Homarus americanus TaxID=6706 RepID=A0A8J5N3T4_HOMAM|nr:Growth hormone-inducible transmembrane protein-like [Homarus americanus]